MTKFTSFVREKNIFAKGPLLISYLKENGSFCTMTEVISLMPKEVPSDSLDHRGSFSQDETAAWTTIF